MAEEPAPAPPQESEAATSASGKDAEAEAAVAAVAAAEQSEADAQLARELSEQPEGDGAAVGEQPVDDGGAALAARLQQEEEDRLYAARLARSGNGAHARDDGTHEVAEDAAHRVVVVAHCVSNYVAPTPGAFTSEALYLVATLADGDSERIDSQLTSPANREAANGGGEDATSGAAWATSEPGNRLVFMPATQQLPSASLCIALYKTSFSTLCCAQSDADPSDDTLVGTTAALPVASRGGDPADWLDGLPRDHYLDDGSILTLTARFISRQPQPPLPPAAEAAEAPAPAVAAAEAPAPPPAYGDAAPSATPSGGKD